MNQTRKRFQGEYPPLALQAFGYHEAGHALLAAFFGLQLDHAWIADGCNGRCEEPEPGVHGTVRIKEGQPRGRDFIAGVFMHCGPEASEKLAPDFAAFHKLHDQYPEIWTEGGNHPNGVKNDLATAFSLMAPHYALMGMSAQDADDTFTVAFRMPSEAIVNAFGDKVHALARQLMKRKWMDGPEIHDMLCDGSTGPALSACQAHPWPAALPELLEQAAQHKKEKARRRGGSAGLIIVIG